MTDLEACKQLLLRLHRRKSVAARELKRALGDQHWNDYQLLAAWAKALREEAKIASYLLRITCKCCELPTFVTPNQIES